MRKRPIYGRSTRSTNSKAVTIKNHQKQSNYQVDRRDLCLPMEIFIILFSAIE